MSRSRGLRTPKHTCEWVLAGSGFERHHQAEMRICISGVYDFTMQHLPRHVGTIVINYIVPPIVF